MYEEIGDKNDSPIFNQQTLAEGRTISCLNSPQFLLTILVKNCGLVIADKFPRQLYKGKYVSQLKVKREIRLSVYRIQRVSILQHDVRGNVAL